MSTIIKVNVIPKTLTWDLDSETLGTILSCTSKVCNTEGVHNIFQVETSVLEIIP